MKKLPVLGLILLISSFSCTSVRKSQNTSIPMLDLSFNSKEIRLSRAAENYIGSVVSIMRKNALHKRELNFDDIQQAIRYYANGAETIEDTHPAIKKSLPLLKDHHSYFMTAEEIKKNLGFSEEDIEEIKKGSAPHIDRSAIDSLKMSLDYASGKLIDGNIAYLAIPSFENLYSEGMTMFADSLQVIIRQFDQENIRGWIIDLRDNSGGAAMPMIAGLGPLLDENNAFYTVDKEGKVLSKTYYRNGGYYDVETNKKRAAPIIRSTIDYQLNNDRLPVAILTNTRTASSAEAVTAIFAGQPNGRIIGSKTAGLTSTNDFNFLSDNSALNITIGYYANRHHQLYEQGIAPDIAVENDLALQKAMDWIRK